MVETVLFTTIPGVILTIFSAFVFNKIRVNSRITQNSKLVQFRIKVKPDLFLGNYTDGLHEVLKKYAKLVFISSNSSDVLGAEGKFLTGGTSHFLTWFDEQDLQGVLQRLHEALANKNTGFIDSGTVGFCLPQGEKRWIEGRIRIVRDFFGLPKFLDGSAYDVTEHVQTKDQLKTFERRVTLVLEAAGMALWEWDTESDQLEFQGDYKKLYGQDQPAGGLKVGDLKKWTHPDDAEKASKLVSGALAQGKNVENAYRIINADGEIRYHYSFGRPVYEKGELKSLMGVVIDRTKEEKAFSEKQRLESHLLRSQRLEALGKLAGGVAHDLNNLLTPMLGFSDLLEDTTQQSEENLVYIQGIRGAAIRARDLVTQLLAYSRRQQLKLQQIQLNDLIQECKLLLKQSLHPDIQMNYQLDDKLSFVLADEGQLGQVLLNLVQNANEAIDGEGLITVRTRMVKWSEVLHKVRRRSGAPAEANCEDWVALSVTDSGQGMSPDVLAKVFEPFFTTKDVGKGTGLGLATAYGILRQHHGYMTVSSKENQGSTFTMLLPAANKKSRIVESPLSDSDSDLTQLPETFSGLNVIVAEDSQEIRQMVLEILMQNHVKILEAREGKEALDLIHSVGSPDILITDVMMPYMSGRELADAVHQEYPDLPILFISGYSEDRLHKLPGSLIHAFLPKPFSRKDLLTVIHNLRQHANLRAKI